MMPSINFVFNPEISSKQNYQLGKPFPKRHNLLVTDFISAASKFSKCLQYNNFFNYVEFGYKSTLKNTTGTAVVKGLVDFGYKN